MSVGQKIIITIGSFVITFVTICLIFRENIDFLLTTRSIERKYGEISENKYFIEDYFQLVDNHNSVELTKREDIINSIYYLLNSGNKFSKRYCSKEYKNCFNDMELISKDSNLLSTLNNYVHPYNSFDSIVFGFNEDVIEIEIKRNYTKAEIEKINQIVETVIAEKITNDMGVRDKIKIIHDYIINNTEYDTLKTIDINDNTYKSNTAYGVLIEGHGICSGYSDAMKIFLDKMNIVNYKVSNEEHIWNLVLIDGEWLHLDLTWDDPVSDFNITRDNYFLIDNNTLKLLDDGVHYYNEEMFLETKK